MNLADLVDEILSVLDGVAGINVAAAGVGATPPTPFIELPEVTYGEYGPGLDRITDLALTVVFGPAANEQTFRLALQHASTTGPQSIPYALRQHTWTSCHTVFVRKAEPDTVEWRGANAAIAYVFHLDISGAP